MASTFSLVSAPHDSSCLRHLRVDFDCLESITFDYLEECPFGDLKSVEHSREHHDLHTDCCFRHELLEDEAETQVIQSSVSAMCLLHHKKKRKDNQDREEDSPRKRLTSHHYAATLRAYPTDLSTR